MASILVVDDEWKVRAFLREALNSAGYEVIEAADGKKALDLYRSAPTDLVISDLFLGEQQGLETILRLTQEFPDAKVIAISGGGEFEDPVFFLNVARSVGARDTLAKPFGVGDLLQKVRSLIGA